MNVRVVKHVVSRTQAVSSLINKLTGENRAYSQSNDCSVQHVMPSGYVIKPQRQGISVFIDTAGLRRKSEIKEDIERYSIIRTVSAVERANVVVLMIDAKEGVTEQDAKIAVYAAQRARQEA
ncbi:MAG: GTPase [Lachnospiraceae bacterium]